ncbi:MAG: DUF4432 family protein, partial [Nitrososphaerota archaeon]
FIQWKMLGEGTYVMGMEPANSLVMGRDKERAWGTLQYIGPQETKEFHIEIGILAGYEIVEFEEKIRRITGGKKPEMIGNVEEFIKTLK